MSTTTALQKRAAEKKRYTLDYTCWLDSGETLTEFTVGILPVTDPVLEADGAWADAGQTKISTYIGGGRANTVYTVTLTATTSLGQIKQDFMQMRVV